MDALKWHGPAQVEWIYDRINDEYKLIEINPRFWGTLELSIEAGINFPKLLLKMVSEGDIEDNFNYEIGVKHKWVYPYEFGHALLDRENSKKRFFDIINPYDIIDKKTHLTFDIFDPLPDIFSFFYETKRLILKYV
jgi:predicted ATP-grasp superfamily ATP-dependent carboligase